MTRLRQIALVAADLDEVSAKVQGALDVQPCFNDPGVAHFGLRNVLFPVGDTFLEIVSPTEPGTTAGRLLERRDGDGGYMVILQTNDLDGVRERCAQTGVRIVFEAAGESILGLHLHPRDIGGAIVSIDRSTPSAEWSWAGPSWREFVSTGTVTEIVGVHVQADDPAEMAARWGAVIGMSTSVDADGQVQIQLEQGRIVFVAVSDGRGEGVSAIECASADVGRVGDRADVGGISVHFV